MDAAGRRGTGNARAFQFAVKARYNEIDRYCCDWLSNLMDAGLITPGDIDDRSIADVSPDDVRGYDRVHWFAGTGGWDLALGIAGWGEAPVWTGSCPCQPLSMSGQRKGHADKRHLWPALFSLITECEPPTFLGEQVAGKDGQEWLAAVRADLEHIGYACGAANLCAASVEAKHPRQRLFFVADAGGTGLARPVTHRDRVCFSAREAPAEHGHSGLPARVCFEPDTESLVRIDGLPRPVGKVRAFGNSIVPQIAAEFIKAFIEAR